MLVLVGGGTVEPVEYIAYTVPSLLSSSSFGFAPVRVNDNTNFSPSSAFWNPDVDVVAAGAEDGGGRGWD